MKEIKLSDIEKTVKEIGVPTVEVLGGGLYRLPGGAITNILGVRQFDKAMREEIRRMQSNKNQHGE